MKSSIPLLIALFFFTGNAFGQTISVNTSASASESKTVLNAFLDFYALLQEVRAKAMQKLEAQKAYLEKGNPVINWGATTETLSYSIQPYNALFTHVSITVEYKVTGSMNYIPNTNGNGSSSDSTSDENYTDAYYEDPYYDILP